MARAKGISRPSRLVVRSSYKFKIALIKFWDTHEEYEGIKRGYCVMMDVKPLHNEQDYDRAARRAHVTSRANGPSLCEWDAETIVLVGPS
jgi:hypothetical protein